MIDLNRLYISQELSHSGTQCGGVEWFDDVNSVNRCERVKPTCMSMYVCMRIYLAAYGVLNGKYEY